MQFEEARAYLEERGIVVERIDGDALRILVPGKEGPVAITAWNGICAADGEDVVPA